MGIRIVWQAENRSNDADFGGVRETYGAMLKFAQQIARPDTEITLRYMEDAPRSFANNLLYPRAVTKVQVVNRIVDAEKEGFDAALAGVCIIDAYSQECRQAVRMPVLGGAESTMLMAQLVGKKFAWVTIAPAFIEPFEAHIRLHGWEHRAIRNQPVRALDPSCWPAIVEAANGKPDRWIEMFDEAAQACVRDGADTVLCGCNPGGALLALAGYTEVRGTGVPVIVGPAAMVKLAESMVDLRRSIGLTKSEAVAGAYRTTPPHILEELQAMGKKLLG
ncbi:aspartate/glutamate racemase family protein [Burkholderia lata]|uniref:aspartate/glutamate racemase family protein n=1 Tax=Burkholderia lata (strain ATCC 17760 / DSM 23089 / LMG 22485 / NCIMB 9086 / R18194 / 383) TaxID=482957 RepID=UPI001453F4D2|nr:aspartate/glutamate racemase family protein [Burkholderia lata]VWL86597.1 Asp/Glu racemase [Burkholderia lata]